MHKWDKIEMMRKQAVGKKPTPRVKRKRGLRHEVAANDNHQHRQTKTPKKLKAQP